MRRHVLSVKIGRFVGETDIAFDVTCYSDANEVCRLMCDNGCESWSIKVIADDGTPYDEQNHPLRSTSCNAVEWFSVVDDGAKSCYIDKEHKFLPLHDESEIEVEWQGDYYGWYLLDQTKAQILNFPEKTALSVKRTAWHETKMGQHSVEALTWLLRQINHVLAHFTKSK